MARNLMISFVPNGKNSKLIPRYLLKVAVGMSVTRLRRVEGVVTQPLPHRS
jgi:hypothetical protein